MRDNYTVRKTVDEWLRTHGDGEVFDIIEFVEENDIHFLEERNCITAYFRDMVKKVNTRCSDINNFSRQITELVDDNKGVNTELKRNMKARFVAEHNIEYDDWIKFQNDEKFEYTKKIMKEIGVHYRIRNIKNNKKEWIVPIFDQRVEKTKESIYSRLSCAIKAAWKEMPLIMINDTSKKSPLECALEIGVLTKIKSEFTNLGGMLDRKIEQLTTSMVNTLQPGDTKRLQP